MIREAPAWLAEFQRRFGDVIRTPLDRASGALLVQSSSYDPRVVGEVVEGLTARAIDRLAVYNRQYWFRLFEVMQSAFPLTARLFGFWRFNDYATRFLVAMPPRGWDVDRAPDGFDAFVEAAITLENEANDDERRILVEGARIDAAWRDVFRAPRTVRFRPSADDATRLLESRLVPSPAMRVMEEHAPLLDLRREIVRARDSSEARVPLPPALPQPRAWALVGRDDGIVTFALEPREAELLRLLADLPVRDALARVEHACAADERASLPAKVHVWLARSVERDCWIGIEP